jgi:NADP-dependent aldehyde dehydrogenase
MLHRGIHDSFESGRALVEKISGVQVLARATNAADTSRTEGAPAVVTVDSQTFLRESKLAHEVFGPFAVIIRTQSEKELEEIARRIDGQLTTTIHSSDADSNFVNQLLPLLTRKAGRVVFNGFPTGVEVSPAMQHGGPWPATTDVRFTSVGTASIFRWVRPISFQNAPPSILPEALRDENPLRIARMVNGKLEPSTAP